MTPCISQSLTSLTSLLLLTSTSHLLPPSLISHRSLPHSFQDEMVPSHLSKLKFKLPTHCSLPSTSLIQLLPQCYLFNLIMTFRYPLISPDIIPSSFSSVTHSCPTLCDPMNRSTPGLPVHHQLPESTQTHVHCFGDVIQPSHPPSSPATPALNLSRHQGLFK